MMRLCLTPTMWRALEAFQERHQIPEGVTFGRTFIKGTEDALTGLVPHLDAWALTTPNVPHRRGANRLLYILPAGPQRLQARPPVLY